MLNIFQIFRKLMKDVKIYLISRFSSEFKRLLSISVIFRLILVANQYYQKSFRRLIMIENIFSSNHHNSLLYKHFVLIINIILFCKYRISSKIKRFFTDEFICVNAVNSFLNYICLSFGFVLCIYLTSYSIN